MVRCFRQLGEGDPTEHHFVWAVIADGDVIFFSDDRVLIEHVETNLRHIQSIDNIQELSIEDTFTELHGWAEAEAALRSIIEKRGERSIYPCLICERPLPAVDPNFEQYQPDGGGEMMLIFGYGSSKFDESPGSTVFTGIVCDSCAADFVPRMYKTRYDLQGQVIQETDE